MRATVQSVKHRFAFYARYAGITGYRLQLVYDNGVGNKGRATVTLLGYFISYQCTKVTGMLHLCMDKVLLHLFVDAVNTAIQGL